MIADALTDYYAVLGIPVDADLDMIKSAYRRLGMLNHPDRGGSHEKMLAINEAFRVLVNPAARADYDQWRAHTADAQTQRNAEQAVSTAAQQAANYPSRSDDIDPWMDSLTKDFLAASYGKHGMWPTAGDSLSGWGFVVAGGALGFYLGWQIFDMEGHANRPLLTICAAAGAWVGQMVHRGVRDSMKSNGSSPNSVPQPSTKEMIRLALAYCPGCNQQLRFPAATTSKLRCPKCKYEFAPG